MKTFEQFITESLNADILYEKTFLELSHLDELEIRFNFISFQDFTIRYYYKDMNLFKHDKVDEYFYINYNDI